MPEESPRFPIPSDLQTLVDGLCKLVLRLEDQLQSGADPSELLQEERGKLRKQDNLLSDEYEEKRRRAIFREAAEQHGEFRRGERFVYPCPLYPPADMVSSSDRRAGGSPDYRDPELFEIAQRLVIEERLSLEQFLQKSEALLLIGEHLEVDLELDHHRVLIALLLELSIVFDRAKMKQTAKSLTDYLKASPLTFREPPQFSWFPLTIDVLRTLRLRPYSLIGWLITSSAPDGLEEEKRLVDALSQFYSARSAFYPGILFSPVRQKLYGLLFDLQAIIPTLLKSLEWQPTSRAILQFGGMGTRPPKEPGLFSDLFSDRTRFVNVMGAYLHEDIRREVLAHGTPKTRLWDIVADLLELYYGGLVSPVSPEALKTSYHEKQHIG